jgi:hypothetical protein
MTSPRRFPPPWHVEQIPGGFKVLDGFCTLYVRHLGVREAGDRNRLDT